MQDINDISSVKSGSILAGGSTLPTFPTDPTGSTGPTDPTQEPELVFPAALAASQAKGAASVRVSRVGGNVSLQLLDSAGKPTAAFIMQPNLNSAKKVVSVSILTAGSTAPAPLSASDKASLSSIVDEVSNRYRPPGQTRIGVDHERDSGWFSSLMTALDCGAAILEGGANPLADAACVLSAGTLPDDGGDDGGDDGDGSGSEDETRAGGKSGVLSSVHSGLNSTAR